MPEYIREISQGTDDWHNLRIGSIGGSSITHVLAKGTGASRKSLMYQLAAEILSGNKTQGYATPAMERGTELEGEARRYYELVTGNTVEQVAMIRADIPRVHVSPDGIIGDDGGIEIKCPNLTTHIETIDTGKIDLKYIRQCQHFLWVTGREWIDFISYAPEIVSNPMWIKRVYPEPKIQAEIETELPLFLKELDELVRKVAG